MKGDHAEGYRKLPILPNRTYGYAGTGSEGVWLMAIVLVRLCVGIWQSMASTTHAIRGTNDVCWAARSKKAPVSIFNTAKIFSAAK